MSSSAVNQYAMGKTGLSGELIHLLGQEGSFEDFDYSESNVIRAALTGMRIHCMWVKNRHSDVLLPSTVVLWHASYVGVGVAAPASAQNMAAGVVDPFIPAAGVAVGDHFWLIRRGPAKIIQFGTAAWDAGDILVPDDTGRVSEIDATPDNDAEAQNQAMSIIGRALADVAITAGVKGRALVNFLH